MISSPRGLRWACVTVIGAFVLATCTSGALIPKLFTRSRTGVESSIARQALRYQVFSACHFAGGPIDENNAVVSVDNDRSLWVCVNESLREL